MPGANPRAYSQALHHLENLVGQRRCVSLADQTRQRQVSCVAIELDFVVGQFGISQDFICHHPAFHKRQQLGFRHRSVYYHQIAIQLEAQHMQIRFGYRDLQFPSAQIRPASRKPIASSRMSRRSGGVLTKTAICSCAACSSARPSYRLATSSCSTCKPNKLCSRIRPCSRASCPAAVNPCR